MTSFLHWLCVRLMGRPVSGACWKCPFCCSSGPAFYVREQMAKFKCYRCDEWGDAADLLRLFEPKLSYPTRLARLDQLKAEFRDQGGVVEDRPAAVPVSSSGESGSQAQVEERMVKDLNKLNGVDLLLALLEAGRIRHSELVHVVEMENELRELAGALAADQLRRLQKQLLDTLPECPATDADHVSVCDDVSCGRAICRRVRALRRAGIDEVDSVHQALGERNGGADRCRS